MSPDDINSQPEIKTINTNNINDSSSSTDSSEENIEILDEEALVYQGYEVLPSVPIEMNENESNDSSTDSETEDQDNLERCIIQILDSNELNGFGQQIDFSEPLPDTTQSAIWNQPTQNDIELTKEKLLTIEQCMANIKLDHIKAPEWAKSIPENEWKENLLKRLIIKE